jgi:magnesium transporter
MKARRYDISASDGLTEIIDPADSLQGVGPAGWVDVEEYSADELEGWLRSHDCPDDILRACSELSGRTRVLVSGSDVFFEFPALASPDKVERVALGFLCRLDTCITMHAEPLEELPENVARVFHGEEDRPVTSSVLVATLLAGLSRRAIDAVDTLRSRVLGLQDRMDRDPDDVEMDDIQALSGAIRTLDGIVSERVVVFDRLRVLETPTLDLAGLGEFQVALTDAQYLDRAIERLEKRVDDLRVRFNMNQQDRTNRRLAVLTVISAVFLPLTLLAGIYGMNFEYMPELAYRYAYPAALGVMVLIALGLLAYFRSRGWFD